MEEPKQNIEWSRWDAVRAATRGLVDDALHLGIWHAPELQARLTELWKADESTAALKLLDDLSVPAPSRTFAFRQEFRVPAAFIEALDLLAEEDRTFTLEEAAVELSRSLALEQSAPGGPESQGSDLGVDVTLPARTPEQAISRGVEYATEAVSRLGFLATLRTLPGSPPEVARTQARDGGRLTEDGKPYTPPEKQDLGIRFAPPSDLNFTTKRPIDSPLVNAVKSLPPLAAIDRGVLLDGRARLARSLHWLALADTAVRPAERLSHGWVAFEHLFADGEQKGHLVAELAAPVVTLCFTQAAGGRLYRDSLAALHTAACMAPVAGSPLQGLVERWLGMDAWPKYVDRGATTTVVPFFQPHESSDEEGVRALLERVADLPAFAKAVEAYVPLVTWQLNALTDALASREAFRGWLFHQKRKSMSFLAGVYEVRNQLVHDANPFGFDDAYRLRDLYERYRVVINPVIAELLRLVGADPVMPLKHAWAILRARYGELYAHQTDSDKKKAAVDVKGLLACLALP